MSATAEERLEKFVERDYAPPIEAWRKCWRDGFAPGLSDAALEALRLGLTRNDEHIIQGSTVYPPPLDATYDWPVECGCPISYAGWKGDGLETVAEVEGFFAEACTEADGRLGDPAACRYLLNWVDDTPRAEMVAALLHEVEREIRRRKQLAEAEAA